MLKIILITLKQVESIPEAQLRLEFPLRYERAMRFRCREDQLRCLGAGVLLHRGLYIKEENLRYNAHGKPYVPEFEGDFSLSHSGELTVLAVSDSGVVGVDVERIDRRHLDIATRVFQPEEIAWMKSSRGLEQQKDAVCENKEEETKIAQEDVNFFRLWTLKESVMKAEGKGLSLSPASFSVLPLIEGSVLSQPAVLENNLCGTSQMFGQHIISCVYSDYNRNCDVKVEMFNV